MDGHDGKQLLHRPTVRHALKQREVAEVGIGEQAVQAFQLLGKIIQFLGQLLDAAADLPVNALRPAALLQRQIAQAEQVQRGIERLLRVVKAFEQVLAGQPAQRLLQIDQRLLDVVGKLRHGTLRRRNRSRPGH